MTAEPLTPAEQDILDVIDFDRGYDDHERLLLTRDIIAATYPHIEAEVRAKVAADIAAMDFGHWSTAKSDVLQAVAAARARTQAARVALGQDTNLRDLSTDDMRREIVLRALNQGALAGFQTTITAYAADLVLAELDSYDIWASARIVEPCACYCHGDPDPSDPCTCTSARIAEGGTS